MCVCVCVRVSVRVYARDRVSVENRDAAIFLVVNRFQRCRIQSAQLISAMWPTITFHDDLPANPLIAVISDPDYTVSGPQNQTGIEAKL